MVCTHIKCHYTHKRSHARSHDITHIYTLTRSTALLDRSVPFDVNNKHGITAAEAAAENKAFRETKEMSATDAQTIADIRKRLVSLFLY
jgi:hypothetical protein